MKIRAAIISVLMYLSYCSFGQQVTQREIVGIWDDIDKNPVNGKITLQLTDSLFILTVGNQKGQSLYKLDTSSKPTILSIYGDGNSKSFEYEIKLSGKDTLVFITIIGVDQEILMHYTPPVLVRRKKR